MGPLARRALLVALLSAAAPVAFVAATSFADPRVQPELEAGLAHAAEALEAGEDLDSLARGHSVWARLLKPDGTVEDHFHVPVEGIFSEGAAEPLVAWEEARPPLAGRLPAAPRCGRAQAGRLLVCERTVETLDGPVLLLDGELRATRSFYDPRQPLGRLTLLSLTLAASVGGWLAWRVVRPLGALRDAVQERVGAPNPPPIASTRRDEVGEVARAFDVLLADVEARRRANQDFAADLVHELKNPIAAARAAAELLPQAQDPERRERLSAIILDSNRRMEAMVRGYLELARAEAGLPHQERVMVDLGELARGIASSVEPSRVAVSGEGSVVGAPEALETALRNLLLNALAWGQRAELRVEGRRVVVEDDGPGIAEEDLPRVFERFFSRRHEGTGLGLPLTRAIVQAHGGRIRAENRAGGGARFVVEL